MEEEAAAVAVASEGVEVVVKADVPLLYSSAVLLSMISAGQRESHFEDLKVGPHWQRLVLTAAMTLDLVCVVRRFASLTKMILEVPLL